MHDKVLWSVELVLVEFAHLHMCVLPDGQTCRWSWSIKVPLPRSNITCIAFHGHGHHNRATLNGTGRPWCRSLGSSREYKPSQTRQRVEVSWTLAFGCRRRSEHGFPDCHRPRPSFCQCRYCTIRGIASLAGQTYGPPPTLPRFDFNFGVLFLA